MDQEVFVAALQYVRMKRMGLLAYLGMHFAEPRR